MCTCTCTCTTCVANCKFIKKNKNKHVQEFHNRPRHSLALEEGNVEDGGVEVDKLEEVHLGDEAVVVLRLSAVELCSQGGEGMAGFHTEGRDGHPGISPTPLKS